MLSDCCRIAPGPTRKRRALRITGARVTGRYARRMTSNDPDPQHDTHRLMIVIASIRQGRGGLSVGRWFEEQAAQHEAFVLDVVDLAELDLPLMTEPNHPRLQRYTQQHTKAWSARVSAADAFVFVIPEYNHGLNAATKNAIDFLYAEWNNKAAGFVGYGSAGGVRAVEQLRLVMAEVQVATVRNQVALSLFTDFEEYTKFKPAAHHEKSLEQMLNQLVAWSGALKTLRDGQK